MDEADGWAAAMDPGSFRYNSFPANDDSIIRWVSLFAREATMQQLACLAACHGQARAAMDTRRSFAPAERVSDAVQALLAHAED